MTKNPKLSRQERKRLKRLHESALRRALRAEKYALERLREIVAGSTAILVSDLATRIARGSAPEATRLAALQGINRAVEHLERETFRGIVDIRSAARALSLEQVKAEVEGVQRWISELETKLGPLPPKEAAPVVIPLAEGPAIDALRARQTAASMASRYGQVASQELTKWRHRGEDATQLTYRVASVASKVDGTVRRHAQAQAHDAFADEKAGFWKRATELGDDDLEGPPLLPYGWRAITFDIWSALLDRKTCPTCWELDGQTVPTGKPFRPVPRPQAHPFCRCEAVTMIVPSAGRARLDGIAIDYAALKADISDYVRGSRLAHQGKRHAVSFTQEAIRTTSPETLTRRMLERRYVDLQTAKPPTLPRLPR